MEQFKRISVGWCARQGRTALKGALRALWAASVLLCAVPLHAASTDSIRIGVTPTDIRPPAAGNASLLTQAVTAQVPDSAPSAPTALTALVTESSATLSWTAPSPNPGDLDFYRIYLNTATPAAWFATATVSVPTLTRGFNPL